MTETQIDAFVEFAKSLHSNVSVKLMNPSDVIFEENVKMNCFYCEKYGNNWRCPPYLPNIDYPKMFSEYSNGIFVWLCYDISDEVVYEQVRNESSVALHRILLNLEKWMWDHNSPNAISFGAGACKLCKDGCGKDKCNNPHMARSPLEATGVNVIKTAGKYGIDISFPADKKLIRLGLLLWKMEEE